MAEAQRNRRSTVENEALWRLAELLPEAPLGFRQNVDARKHLIDLVAQGSSLGTLHCFFAVESSTYVFTAS